MNKLVRGAVATVAVIASFGVAPSAFAATHDNSCDSGESCVFLNSSYGGGMDDMATTDGSFLNNTFSSGYSVHDAISSGFPSDRAVQYFVNTGWSGAYFYLGINQYDSYWGTSQPNASSSSYNFNDKIDSCAIYVP